MVTVGSFTEYFFFLSDVPLNVSIRNNIYYAKQQRLLHSVNDMLGSIEENN